MTNALSGLIASIGLALVITAAVQPKTQTQGVITALTTGGAHLEEAALGQKP
jgi:hypothetical protein